MNNVEGAVYFYLVMLVSLNNVKLYNYVKKSCYFFKFGMLIYKPD